MQIRSLLKEKSQNQGRKTAIFFENKEISFQELKDKSFKVANYLLEAGPQKNKKVALYLPNRVDTVFSIFGILSTGGMLVPLDYMLTETEIINFISHSEAETLFIQPKSGVDINRIKNQCPGLKRVVIFGQKEEGETSFSEVLEKNSSQEPEGLIEATDSAAIFYTSGSTGHPKGVTLTYRHLENPVEVIEHYLTVSSKDTFLCGGIPFSHIGGLDFILFMLYFGFTLVLMERFQPVEFLRNIEKHKVTLFCIVPAMFMAILFLKEAERFDLASLKYAVVFGAPSSPAVLKRFHKLCPNAELRNGWGMTETSAPNAYSPSDQNKLASIGKFDFNMEARIVDNQGNPVSPGQKGELQVRGKGVMESYHKEPELTKEVFSEDGWLKTGDIACRDEEGFFYIVGRIKDMIKVAGEIVFSSEVEEAIQRFPGVKEVAVIGIEDKLRGEVPKAFLAVEEKEKFNQEELKDYLRKNLASFKNPHHFEFIEQLPKNRAGKIDKQALKAKVES